MTAAEIAAIVCAGLAAAVCFFLAGYLFHAAAEWPPDPPPDRPDVELIPPDDPVARLAYDAVLEAEIAALAAARPFYEAAARRADTGDLRPGDGRSGSPGPSARA